MYKALQVRGDESDIKEDRVLMQHHLVGMTVVRALCGSRELCLAHRPPTVRLSHPPADNLTNQCLWLSPSCLQATMLLLPIDMH